MASENRRVYGITYGADAGQLGIPLGQFAYGHAIHRRQFRLDVHARRPFLRLSRAITARTSGHTGPRRADGAKAILGGTGRFLGCGTCGRFGGMAMAQDASGKNGGHRLPAILRRHVCSGTTLAHRHHLPTHVEHACAGLCMPPPPQTSDRPESRLMGRPRQAHAPPARIASITCPQVPVASQTGFVNLTRSSSCGNLCAMLFLLPLGGVPVCQSAQCADEVRGLPSWTRADRC